VSPNSCAGTVQVKGGNSCRCQHEGNLGLAAAEASSGLMGDTKQYCSTNTNVRAAGWCSSGSGARQQQLLHCWVVLCVILCCCCSPRGPAGGVAAAAGVPGADQQLHNEV
jgi:hypothetical protein